MSENNILEQIQKVMVTQASTENCAKECSDATDLGVGWVDAFIGDMGGFSVAMGAMKTAASCAEKLFPENKTYQKTARIVGSSIPVMMTAHRSYKIISSYFEKRRRAKRPVIDEEDFIIRHILDVDMEREYVERMAIRKKDMPIIEWMHTFPQTDAIQFLAMFDEDFNHVDDMRKRKKPISSYYLVFEFKCEDDNIRFVLRCTTDLVGDFSKKVASIHFNGKYFFDFMMVLMNYAYIDSLDYKNNIITIRESIEASPRREVDHGVYQLSEEMRTEITKSIEKKKKRGYAIAGLPGTGKSTMVDKIIDDFRDIPVISIPCECHVEFDVIRNALIMSQLVSPCIVVFEDIDSLPLGDKHSPHLATFIEFLDSSKYDKPVIFMATMNEPENIHESLMDRRGRFDRVILVDPPKIRRDIMEVMSNVYAREFDNDMPGDMLGDEFFDVVSKCGMRHSDYAEIIRRVKINDMPLVSESFTCVAKSIRDTQNAVDNFKDRGKKRQDPEGNSIEEVDLRDDCPDKCYPEAELAGLAEGRPPGVGVGVGVG